ncbi:MAG: hypothetical protein JXR58_13315 [Bacteroidales bacterium]|nr:hypothetical protein [Bacteroidales bacterium]
MKLKIIILILCLNTTGLLAQDYIQAVGYRGGFTNGITGKMFVDAETAYEGLVAFRYGGIHFAAYKLKHKAANWKYSDKLFVFTGFGVHAGFFNNYDTYNFLSPFRATYKRNITYSVIGLDGVLGLEYRFIKHPFVAAIDFNPFFDLFGPNYFNMHINNFAISIKYCLQ